jgi:hypothetical protein
MADIGQNIAQEEAAAAPLGGTRSQAMHRLQVGMAGIAAMLLLVGLANVIQNRARISDETAVPDAAPTTEPNPSAPQRDPLADAGLVPDLPAESTAKPQQEQAILPEQRQGDDPR